MKVVYPKNVGGQKGSSGHTLSRSGDAGQLATQVIGDVIGQKTALAEAKDQLTLGEQQLTEQQNVAYRESNVQAQMSLNQEQPPPNGWTQIFSQLIGAAGAFFGGPVGAGVLGVQPQFGGGGYGGGYGSGGYPWMSPYGWGQGYGGYYPQQYFPSPYESMPWAWG